MLVRIVQLVSQALFYLVFVRVVFSFIPMGINTHSALLALRRIVYRLSEPVLAPFRRLISPIVAGSGVSLDLSPLIALFVINALERLIIRTILGF